jgi:hypothetical protein
MTKSENTTLENDFSAEMPNPDYVDLEGEGRKSPKWLQIERQMVRRGVRLGTFQRTGRKAS